jgi:hypothetical protein
MSEYSSELISKCRTNFYQGFESIYVTVSKKNKNRKLLLSEFQTALESIHLWNSNILEKEYERFRLGCVFLDDLIEASFLNIAKDLLKNVENKDSINIMIPSGSNFIHKCYVNIAREIWKNPKLFYNRLSRNELKENMEDTYTIIDTNIISTLRNELPFKDMLQSYLNKPKLITPEEGMPEDVKEVDVPEEDASEVDVPEEDASEVDVPEEDASEVDVPEEDVSEVDVPEEDVPDKGVPDKGVPDEDVSDEDDPDEDVLEEDDREENVPEEDDPEKDVLEEDGLVGVSGVVLPESDAPGEVSVVEVNSRKGDSVLVDKVGTNVTCARNVSTQKSDINVSKDTGSVEGEDLGAGSVDGKDLGAGSVDGKDLGAGSVDGKDLDAGSVDNGDSGEGSVEGGDSGEGSVEGGDSGEGSVEGGDSDAGSVEGGDSDAGSVDGEDSGDLDVASVEGGDSDAGSVDGEDSGAGSVEGEVLESVEGEDLESVEGEDLESVEGEDLESVDGEDLESESVEKNTLVKEGGYGGNDNSDDHELIENDLRNTEPTRDDKRNEKHKKNKINKINKIKKIVKNDHNTDIGKPKSHVSPEPGIKPFNLDFGKNNHEGNLGVIPGVEMYRNSEDECEENDDTKYIILRPPFNHK